MLFLKMGKILCRSRKCKQNSEKLFLVLGIMAFEPLAGIFLNSDENTCDRQSMCYQTALRFHI